MLTYYSHSELWPACLWDTDCQIYHRRESKVPSRRRRITLVEKYHTSSSAEEISKRIKRWLLLRASIHAITYGIAGTEAEAANAAAPFSCLPPVSVKGSDLEPQQQQSKDDDADHFAAPKRHGAAFPSSFGPRLVDEMKEGCRRTRGELDLVNSRKYVILSFVCAAILSPTA